MRKTTFRFIGNAMHLIARGLAMGRLEVRASGVHHIPEDGPAVVVARHYHHFYDGLALLIASPRHPHIVVTLDWVSGRATRHFMEWMARIARWPTVLRRDALAHVHDGTGPDTQSAYSLAEVTRYQRAGLRKSVELLTSGALLVIFPEGYPNIDPHYAPKKHPNALLDFRPGFAIIAAMAEQRLNSQIPIIPMGLSYAFGSRWVAYLRVGPPVYRSDFGTRNDLIQWLEKRVAQLSGLEQRA